MNHGQNYTYDPKFIPEFTINFCIKLANNEQRFYEILEKQFLGKEIKGKSGFVNLLKVKSEHYKKFKPELEKYVNGQLEKIPKAQRKDAKEIIFDRFYTFFSRYFSENGSVYFNSTSFNEGIFEQVYTDKKDVELFYKTRMLHYVKSDRLYSEMEMDENGYTVSFDVSDSELHKQANEKKEILFELRSCDRSKKQIIFLVKIRKGARITKYHEISKQLLEKDIEISDQSVADICNTFLAQNEFDFFINKDAKKFLTEQWKFYSFNFFDNVTEFDEERIVQMQVRNNIVERIIDFISQFEDELLHIWEKPKIVKNSNFVISKDRLLAGKNGKELLKKLMKHDNYKEQENEWKELRTKHMKKQSIDGKNLPIDTKFFPDLKKDFLQLFENIDDALDGYLIHSENWQALNTILPKFEGKVQTLFSDPPFNKENEADYHYNVKYKDSTWLTIIQNRLEIAREFLTKKGSSFLRCDYNGNMYMRMVLDDIFGQDRFVNEITIGRSNFNLGTTKDNKYSVNTDSLFLYSKTEDKEFQAVTVKNPRAGERTNLTSIAGGRRPQQRIKYEKEVGKGEPYILLERADIDTYKKNIFPKPYHFQFTQMLWDQGFETEDYSLHFWQNSTEGFIRRFVPKKKIKDVKVTLMVDSPHREGYQVFDKKTTTGIEKNDCVFLNVSESGGNKDQFAVLSKCKLYQNVGTKDKPKWTELKGKWEPFDKSPGFKLGKYMTLTNDWKDIDGNGSSWGFETENSEFLLQRVIGTTSFKNDKTFVMDFFSGSGTTIATAHKLGKRWIGIEQGEHFWTHDLPRMKCVLAGEKSGITDKKQTVRDGDIVSETTKKGGFFKYYELEQHEEVLRNLEYKVKSPMKNKNPNDPDDIFLEDLRLLKHVGKDGLIDLKKLDPKIDIAETLSNLLGKKIKKCTENDVEFEDGEVIKFDKIDSKKIKELLWWSN